MIITDEMALKVLSIATRRHEVGASDGGTYAVSVPTLETMRAAIEAVVPMVLGAQWQPIETAPKHLDIEDVKVLDAQPPILLYCPDDGRMHVAYWERYQNQGWTTPDIDSVVLESGEPTHWMPLPPPPSVHLGGKV